VKALVFDIRLNSLYSIRIPFTWQSALSYPILPPSAVIGMLANALQRYKNDKHPLEYLDLVEDNILWGGSRLLTPCVIKSYITSAIVKWGDMLGGKFTNALGKQYAYSRKLQIAAIFKSEALTNEIIESLKTSPLTCGDSESPISLESAVMSYNVSKPDKEIVQTKYPVPFTKNTKIIVNEDTESNGQVYLMHERCKKQGNNFPLISYMVPIREEQRILKPSSLTVKISNEKVLEIEGIGHILLRDT
jgi:CRISPR-associated Cas5-like protein